MFKPVALITKAASLSDPVKYDFYFERLPEERKEKLSKMKNAGDRYESLAAFALLQKALSGLDLPCGDIEIEYGPNEKPYIKNSSIYFNLSHADGISACAVSPFEIGCDIEKAAKNRMIIAKRKFCPEEYQLLLKETDEEKQNLLFTRIWTVKESVLKALGKGITIPVNSFLVDLDADMTAVDHEELHRTLYYREYKTFTSFCFTCSCKEKSGLPKEAAYIEL